MIPSESIIEALNRLEADKIPPAGEEAVPMKVMQDLIELLHLDGHCLNEDAIRRGIASILPAQSPEMWENLQNEQSEQYRAILEGCAASHRRETPEATHRHLAAWPVCIALNLLWGSVLNEIKSGSITPEQSREWLDELNTHVRILSESPEYSTWAQEVKQHMIKLLAGSILS